MSTYNVKILEKMVDNCTMNINMFMSYYPIYENYKDEEAKAYKIRRNEEKIATLIATRRYLAALIENGGVKDKNFESFNGVYLDTMAYSATAGADTSWWTKGT